jgi:phosphatidylinositol alpha-mannosyltransferase
VAVQLDVVGQGDPRIPQPAGLHGLTFHGRVSEAALKRRFHECDIFVAPSTGQESFGIVLLEAMASGRPVVCSDIEGYRQVVSREGARLAPPRDAGALTDILEGLCRDRALCRAMGQHNLVEVQKYDWARLAPQVREEYELALRHRVRLPLGRRWTVYRKQPAPPAAVEPVEEMPGRVASNAAP